MKKYELLLVLPGTLDEKEAEDRSNEILSVVKDCGSEPDIASMGKMRLAYPIKQIRYGYFYTIVFSAESKELKTIQTKLGLMRDLLRAIISIHNPDYTSVTNLTITETQSIVNTADKETIVLEKNEKVTEKPADKKISIQDIDKKLDEILAGEIISGV